MDKYNICLIWRYPYIIIFIADNGNQALDIFIKMHNFPPLSVTGSSVSRRWCAWKQKFLSFLQKEDAKELYKNQWKIILLMLIGPVGEEAYNNLSRNVHQTKDLGTILHELDMYFIFGFQRKKQRNESIDKYVDSLMVRSWNFNNTVINNNNVVN